MRFFEVLVPKASAILFPVLRLVGDSGRYNVPIRFASEAWPRPGLAWPRPGLAEPQSASIAGF